MRQWTIILKEKIKTYFGSVGFLSVRFAKSKIISAMCCSPCLEETPNRFLTMSLKIKAVNNTQPI